MVAVALVGGDGAGKSTLARELVAASAGRARYVYMGMNPDSSNFSLPTTRLMLALKKRKAGAGGAGPVSLHSLAGRKVERGRVMSALRLVNRVAEESVRQLISWWHQLAGLVVVYDRHFLFDYWPSSPGATRPLSDRLHLWFLRALYPKPGVVVFLDAPAEVLLARKQEVPAGYLENRRRAILEAGRHVRRFEVVDAARPVDELLATVTAVIEEVSPGFTTGRSGSQR